MIYGEPHFETRISIYLTILSLFILSVVLSIVTVSITKKWSQINLATIIKSNSILYIGLLFLYIISFTLQIYIGSFSAKNDGIEKFLYLLFFVLFFLCQCFFFYKYLDRKAKDTFFKKYRFGMVLFYLFSLIYILTCYFPDDASDKYLNYSKTIGWNNPKTTDTIVFVTNKTKIHKYR